LTFSARSPHQEVSLELGERDEPEEQKKREEGKAAENAAQVTGGKGGDRRSKVSVTVDLADLDITKMQSSRR
jgi:hypothetical protein